MDRTWHMLAACAIFVAVPASAHGQAQPAERPKPAAVTPAPAQPAPRAEAPKERPAVQPTRERPPEPRAEPKQEPPRSTGEPELKRRKR